MGWKFLFTLTIAYVIKTLSLFFGWNYAVHPVMGWSAITFPQSCLFVLCLMLFTITFTLKE